MSNTATQDMLDPWTPWNGGICPAQPERLVVVRRRYSSTITARAADLRWSHDQYLAYGADDIIAFRYLPVS